jgi:DeoR family transcriptional regulator of aga operon/DeoR family fructose operon transcriptional repressor
MSSRPASQFAAPKNVRSDREKRAQERAAQPVRPLLAASRHALILRRLERQGHATVEELAEAVATSTATVRRDLSLLEEAGRLGRVHGGAVLTNAVSVPLPATAQDEALAAAVYQRLVPGDAVILEGAQVMPLVARRLAAEPMRLIIVTNQLEVARSLLGRSGIETIMLGGKLHPSGHTLPQPLGAGDLKFLVANKAFVEVEGVHPSVGITTTANEEARFKTDLLHHALHKTVVAPFARFGLAFAHGVMQTAEIDRWITTRVEPGARDEVAALGCEIVESLT